MFDLSTERIDDRRLLRDAQYDYTRVEVVAHCIARSDVRKDQVGGFFDMQQVTWLDPATNASFTDARAIIVRGAVPVAIEKRCLPHIVCCLEMTRRYCCTALNHPRV
jgi:hypothetical protein